MKKQKLALVVVLLLLCVGLAFSLTSCGDDDGEHTHTPNSAVRENEADSSCSKVGSYDEVVYCSVCEIELSRTEKEISLKDHTSSDWITDIEATCKVEGTKHKECTVCHTELETGKIDKLTTHTPAEAVRENEVAAKCDVLGSYDEVIYCSVCDIQISRTSKEIAKSPHTEVIDKAIEATETSDGLTEGKHCGVCGEIIIAQQIIPASLQGTAVKSKLLTVEGDKIYGSVSNTTTIFSFLNDITVNGNASYILSRDIECENEITSKTVGINIGDNIFYILVTNGKNARLYTITLRRLPMYTVSFNTNGGTELETISFEEGNFEYPETSKRGYNLDGWKVNGKLVSFPYSITENTEFEAVFSPIVYDITYELNGAVNAEENPDNYTIETSTIMLGTPTRDHYDFAGWYYNEDFEGDAVTQISLGSIGDVKLYAKWTPTVYEIKYNLNGGENNESNPKDYTVESDTITLANPTRVGYTFNGWFINEVCIESITEISHGSHGKVEIYAKWEAIVYNIDYELNGGVNAENNPDTYTIETSTITLATPTRDYYDFVGWYDNAKYEGKVITQITPDSISDVVLYARWTPSNYRIEYHLNGGKNDENNPSTYTIETNTITLCAPIRDYYDFAGWYENSDFEGDAVTQITLNSTGDVTLYAKWTPTIYKIIYSLDGGENNYSNPASYTIESDTIILAKPSRAGYVFIGWYNDAECTESMTEISHGSHGIVEIYAKWEAVYKISGSSILGLTDYAKNNLTELDIPSTIDGIQITSISYSAFKDCDSLTSVTIPDSVTSIEEDAFYHCDKLERVVIGEGVISIADYAFFYCNNLMSIVVGSNVQSIEGNNTFFPCNNLIEVINKSALPINKGETTYGYIAYDAIEVHNGASRITRLDDFLFYTDSDGVNYLFKYLGNEMENLVLPDSYYGEEYVIYNDTFANFSWLISISIGDGATRIGDYAFSNCVNLESVIIGNSVLRIDDAAFQGCSALKSIVVPDSVTRIEDSVFANCTALSSVTIGKDVAYIGKYAFSNCSLTEVVFITTNGWSRWLNWDYPIGDVDSSYLENPTNAASMLKEKIYYWSRS